MKRYLFIINLIFLLTFVSVLPAFSLDVFQKYEKVILINQHKQVAAIYEAGEKIREFPVMTGDDEFTTNPGTYVVKLKDDSYYSRTSNLLLRRGKG